MRDIDATVISLGGNTDSYFDNVFGILFVCFFLFDIDVLLPSLNSRDGTNAVTNGQVPSWLDVCNPRIRIVTHEVSDRLFSPFVSIRSKRNLEQQ